jgi:hypothetical protein
MNETENVRELGYSSESSESLLKLCRERKYIGWEKLKAWNDLTRNKIRVSLSFINDLHLRISSLLKQSSDRVDTITKFLEKMSIVLVSEIHLKDHLNLFSMESREEMNSLEKIKRSGQRENEPILYAMSEFNREYGIFNEKLEDLSKKIKTDIVQHVLKDLVGSQLEIMNNKMKMFGNLKKTLMKKNNSMIDKIKKLNKTFEESRLPKSRTKRAKFNSFDIANQFTKSVKHAEFVLSSVGITLVEIWNQCIVLEEQRLKAIKVSMLKFLDILENVYGAEAQRTFKNRYFFWFFVFDFVVCSIVGY